MSSGRVEKVLPAGPDTGRYVMAAHRESMFEVTISSLVEDAVLVDQHHLAVRGRNTNTFVGID